MGARRATPPKLRAPEARPVLIVVPDFPVSTGEAYGWVSASRGAYAPAASLLALETLATWEGLASIATNDFERVVAARHSQIAELVDELAANDAIISMMSGSGSAVFGVFDALPDAAALVRSTGCRVYLTETARRVASVSIES